VFTCGALFVLLTFDISTAGTGMSIASSCTTGHWLASGTGVGKVVDMDVQAFRLCSLCKFDHMTTLLDFIH